MQVKTINRKKENLLKIEYILLERIAYQCLIQVALESVRGPWKTLVQLVRYLIVKWLRN